MDADGLLDLLMHGNQLKRTARTGWGQRGVPSPENVAAHSYGVVFAALLLFEVVGRPLDLATVLAMATLHDLPEGLTTDIPAPAWRFLPNGAKAAAEQQAMEQIVSDASVAARWLDLWAELRQNETAESQLVHDADKIDQYLQAYIYERQTGNRQLAEFWQKPHRFHFPEAQAVYEELRRRRATAAASSL
jgi:putative hydrolase of HD superfamily